MYGKVAVFLATLITVVAALVEFDNRVTGTPIIVCERDYIKFTVPTQKKFNGKVYVKGEYTNNDCIKNYGLYHRTGSFGNSAGTTPRADDYREYTNMPLGNGNEQFLSSPSSGSSQGSGSKFNSGYGSGSKSNGESNNGAKKPHFFKGHRPSATKVLEEHHGHGSSGSSASANGFGNGGNDRFGSQHSQHGSGGKSGPSMTLAAGYGANEHQYTTSGGKAGASSGNHYPSSDNFGHGTGGSGHHHHSSQNGPYSGSSSGYGSTSGPSNPLTSAFRVLPDANGECPLTCPPCASCDHPSKGLRKSHDDILIFRPRRSYDDSDTSATLDIKLGTCNARRDRTVNPAGVHISFTVVVSFHENFITKVDKAYHISCMYEEADRTVFTQIDVSAPPAIDLEGTIEPPQCRYLINRPNGGPIRDVNVGTEIEHRWECTSSNGYDNIHELYGLLVHNCYVEDGRGRRELVIDERGCSVQPLVIGTPVYSETSMSATIQSLTIKFPDRETVDFQCSISHCLKAEGNCQAVTPPKCDGSRARRSTENETTIISREEWKLHAPRLHVMDIDADIKQSDIDELQALVSLSTPQPLVRNRFEELCVSVVSFGLIIASSTFLLTVSLVVLTGLAFLRAAPQVGKQMSYRI